ncbi:MAG: beta-ketoacyl-ACP synthase [Oceanococcus sp.]
MADLHRVVVTGIAGFSPLGKNWKEIRDNLESSASGVCRMDEWENIEGMSTCLGAPVSNFELPDSYTRKKTRAMGRVALLAVRATELALEDADLLNGEPINDGRTGVAYGSSSACTKALNEFSNLLRNNTTAGLNSTSYLRMMPHTAAASISMHFGFKGRVIPTSSACVSGSQGIGYAYESIRFGRVERMIAGGSEGLCPSQAAVFDTLYATSTRNDQPKTTPAPFDQNRDGLVIGEGACSFVLESLDAAQKRGARIYAEIVGFGSNSDGAHATRPNQQMMGKAMRLAMDDANLKPDQIGFVCAHGTATDQGDIAESQATAGVMGQKPMASYKGHMGHTLGACGALESWFSIEMMRQNRFYPTLNLQQVDSRCGDVDYIMGGPREIKTDYVMNNNFAFGGVNSSLIFKRWSS